mmetsp:Transcript_1534/g.6088  ORF Transcript_1534/g.6088 Transcript_1534/m.6088 type:complete len:357 (-) Transcript_1534:396-1466(-)
MNTSSMVTTRACRAERCARRRPASTLERAGTEYSTSPSGPMCSRAWRSASPSASPLSVVLTSGRWPVPPEAAVDVAADRPVAARRCRRARRFWIKQSSSCSDTDTGMVAPTAMRRPGQSSSRRSRSWARRMRLRTASRVAHAAHNGSASAPQAAGCAVRAEDDTDRDDVDEPPLALTASALARRAWSACAVAPPATVADLASVLPPLAPGTAPTAPLRAARATRWGGVCTCVKSSSASSSTSKQRWPRSRPTSSASPGTRWRVQRSCASVGKPSSDSVCPSVASRGAPSPVSPACKRPSAAPAVRSSARSEPAREGESHRWLRGVLPSERDGGATDVPGRDRPSSSSAGSAATASS